MGLDMYLSAEFYVGDWDHSDADEKARHKAILTACGLDGVRCREAPALTVSVHMAYWRKAHQIHGWFVSNVQNDVDNCVDYYVSRENLADLVAECKGCLADQGQGSASDAPLDEFMGCFEIAKEGDAEELQDTVKTLEAILADARFEHCDFNYRSSW